MERVKKLFCLLLTVYTIQNKNNNNFASAVESNSNANISTPLIYSAVASKILAPNSPYTVDLFVEESTASSSLSFTAKLNSNTETFNAGAISVSPGKTDRITFNIEDLAESRYNLTLKIRDSGTGKEWENVTSVFASKKDRSILLHTDKAIYKPGETVKFRVVVLNRELKPFATEQAVEIKILDPERNVIKLWEKARVKNGLFKNKLELSAEPVLGDWKVEVKPLAVTSRDQRKKSLDGSQTAGTTVSPNSELDDLSLSPPGSGDELSYDGNDDDDFDGETSSTQSAQITRLQFSVEKYVLPKFKVEVKLPPFVTFTETKVPVTVEAKYTYGKGVQGEATITPKLPYYWRSDGRAQPLRTTTLSLDESGRGTAEIEINHLFDDREIYETDLEFEASFTENVTGKVSNTTGRVHLYKLPYKISSFQKSTSFKPGLPFSVTFKISTQDDIPIGDSNPNALQITHGFSYNIEGSQINSSIPANGLLTLTFDTPTNELITVNTVEVKYKELLYSYWVPSKTQSNSKTYLNIEILNGKTNEDGGETRDIIVPLNSEVRILVNCTKPFKSINYLTFGRAKILSKGKIDLPSPAREFQFSTQVLESAKPEAVLLVYLVLDELHGNEIIAESVKFKVSEGPSQNIGSGNGNARENFLNISLSEDIREPGQNLTLHIKSNTQSIVALRGVDQSVLLLKEDNDINQKSIDRELLYRNDEAINVQRVWGGSSSFQVFEQAGIVILTNGGLEVEQRSGWWRPGFGIRSKGQPYAVEAMAMSADFADAPMRRAGAGPAVNRLAFKHARPVLLSNSRGDGGAGGGLEIRVRSEFPETWLWEEINMNDSNTVELVKTVPDTLTSWIITGYSLNTESGIGALYQPQKLTVFRPFFISLNLPYSVVKGEVLALQVLVHNYMRDDSNVTADITLDNSEGKFQFAEESIKDAKTVTRRVTVRPNSVSSTSFIIIPKVFGSVLLNVKGVTVNGVAGDALSQPLRVIPPGEKQRRSVATLLNVKKEGEIKKVEAQLKAEFPRLRVEGADKVKLTVISDLLGSTIENLDKLIQMPTGCGEQNMLNFVADIVILNYLESSHSLRSNIKTKAIKYLETGYQRELTYKHSDGSYSAFGQSNGNTGSTWLTAFVARSFLSAKSYINIDDRAIDQALQFLAKQQDEDNGGVFEYGKVIHSDMQGGSSSNGVALTSYALLAFIEAQRAQLKKNANANSNSNTNANGRNKNNLKTPDYSINIERAIKFIVNNTQYNKKEGRARIEDPYALVLTTYALHMADHKDKDKYFDIMNRLSVEDGNLLHWTNVQPESSSNDTNTNTTITPKAEQVSGKIIRPPTPIPHPWEHTTKPVTVEMTAYALLVYIARGKTAEAFPIVKWLLQQQNSRGGFVSTQDTAVGLTALAKFAELTKDTSTDLDIVAKYENEDRKIKVNNSTAIVLQEFILPETTRSVDLSATGSGTVMTQLSWSYHVETEVREPAFSLDVKVKEKHSSLWLKVCTAFLRGNASNMAIVEINLPSGYAVDKESLDEYLNGVPNFRRYDTENMDSRLEVYLDSIEETPTTCLELLANRVFKIAKKVKTYVTVYDYYDPTRKARTFYDPPSDNNNICSLCSGEEDCQLKNCA